MTIKKVRRTSEDENLTDEAIKRAIALLEAEKPGTKKDACGILRIAYNTTRLDRIIAEFKERKEADAKRRAEKRGKPATEQEISYIITEYMEGQPLDAISKGIYRGTGFIKAVLAKYNVPEKPTSRDYFHPELIPDGAVRSSFKIGERVYSVRYNSLAEVQAEYKYPDGFVYRLWLLDENENQSCYQPWWEIASLAHLEAIGIKF